MNKRFAGAAAGAAAIALLMATGGIASAEGRSGEALFKQNCAVCHPDGGNVINPQKTLHKKFREANNVKTADDIIKQMRNPGPGMTRFDAKTLPDKNARMIADYIIKTYQ